MAKVVDDAEAGALDEPPDADRDACAAWLPSACPDAVTWEGWQSIDAQERAAGEPHGRPRVKLMRLDELVEAARSAAPPSAAQASRPANAAIAATTAAGCSRCGLWPPGMTSRSTGPRTHVSTRSIWSSVP